MLMETKMEQLRGFLTGSGLAPIIGVVVIYFLARIEQHLAVIRGYLDRHHMNVEESLKEISYNTSQTTDSIQDLSP